MTEAGANSRAALLERRASGALSWSGPAAMLFARSAFALLAHGLVAALFALQGSRTPWRDAAPWFPVFATLIDAGCLGMLWLLARREGIRLVDLLGFDGSRWGRDILLGVALVLPSLVFIFGGIAGASLIVYGAPEPPPFYQLLPLPAALYAAFAFPLIWGVTEQMTYNGYLAPRFEALSGSTAIAVAVVAFSWSFQHVVMPVQFDGGYALYRLLSPVPFTAFITLLYLRTRRLLPLAVAHALMDGMGEFAGVLWPLLQ